MWDDIQAMEATARRSEARPRATETPYSRAVVEDFIEHLPEALRTDGSLGREFLTEVIQHIRLVDADARPRECPICHVPLGKLTPQHMKRHGLTLAESCRGFPELGSSKKARLVIQPSPGGLFEKIPGLMVAGAGYAECYTEPVSYWIDLILP